MQPAAYDESRAAFRAAASSLASRRLALEDPPLSLVQLNVSDPEATHERETPSCRSICLTDQPFWRNSRARSLSSVFTTGNIPEASDVVTERAAGVEPALRGWKPLVLPLNYARASRSVAPPRPARPRSFTG